jgi:hypothetical protein
VCAPSVSEKRKKRRLKPSPSGINNARNDTRIIRAPLIFASAQCHSLREIGSGHVLTADVNAGGYLGLLLRIGDDTNAQIMLQKHKRAWSAWERAADRNRQ